MKIEIEKDECLMLKKYAHAEICFHNCAEYLNLYFDEQVQWTSIKSRALLTAATIEYAKPFKKSRGIEKIDESIIPAKYEKLHGTLIKSRDKYIAHLDKRGLENPDREFHRIHLIKKGSVIDIQVESPRMPLHLIKQMKLLALELEKKSKYHWQKYIKKNQKKMFAIRGDIIWELRIGNDFCGLVPVGKEDLTKYEWE